MSVAEFTARQTDSLAFAQMAAQQVRDELDEFFENSAVGLNLLSAEGTILRANRAELQLLGYPA